MMDSRPIAFDQNARLGVRRAIIRRNPDDMQEVEMVEGVWGSDPRFSDGENFRFIRSENQAFPGRRCLLAVSEFQMAVGDKRYRATREEGGHFYLAGIWEPGIEGSAPFFRVITVAANPDISAYQKRHGAIVPTSQVEQWLDSATTASACLTTPPAGFFRVNDGSPPPCQRSLAL